MAAHGQILDFVGACPYFRAMSAWYAFSRLHQFNCLTLPCLFRILICGLTLFKGFGYFQLDHMNRHRIRDEIASIKPLDPLEVAHQADALAWVDSGAELTRLIKPATPPKHLVSYFAVANAASILLVDHKNAQLWLPTGGHVEPGEHPRETVSRELAEELGFLAAHEIGENGICSNVVKNIPACSTMQPVRRADLWNRLGPTDWY
jgi:hypothetical protein